MTSVQKYFITSQPITQLPVWFRDNSVKKKTITVLTIYCEGNDKLSVHSNIATQGDCEFAYGNYEGIEDEEKRLLERNKNKNQIFAFVCYANEERMSKQFIISRHQFDEIEFWFVTADGEKITPHFFRAELLLEIEK